MLKQFPDAVEFPACLHQGVGWVRQSLSVLARGCQLVDQHVAIGLSPLERMTCLVLLVLAYSGAVEIGQPRLDMPLGDHMDDSLVGQPSSDCRFCSTAGIIQFSPVSRHGSRIGVEHDNEDGFGMAGPIGLQLVWILITDVLLSCSLGAGAWTRNRADEMLLNPPPVLQESLHEHLLEMIFA
jgi:hypothetical protein